MAKRGAKREQSARKQLDFWQRRLGAESKGVERIRSDDSFTLREEGREGLWDKSRTLFFADD